MVDRHIIVPSASETFYMQVLVFDAHTVGREGVQLFPVPTS